MDARGKGTDDIKRMFCRAASTVFFVLHNLEYIFMLKRNKQDFHLNSIFLLGTACDCMGLGHTTPKNDDDDDDKKLTTKSETHTHTRTHTVCRMET